MLIKKIITSLCDIVFPNPCIGCGGDIPSNSLPICYRCLSEMPLTNNMESLHNATYQLFNGRLNLIYASSLLFYNKHSLAQELIHALKYKGRKDIGIFLGKMMGNSLAPVHASLLFDAIIPLPLHPKKLNSRGYNQAQVLAEGIKAEIDLPILENTIYRKQFNQTQTKKSRINRWLNVEHIFDVRNAHELENKHLLVIDDVVTTGATLESFCIHLQKIKNTKISICSTAIATNT